MKNVTPDQQTMLATWQQHTYAEFVLKDADAALATMTENPHVLLIASGVVRVGRAAVREFYADKFLPNIPADLEITTLSQTFGDDRIVEEMAVRLTHTIDMDWLLRGYGPPAEEPNSWSPFSSNSMAAKSRTSMLTGIRRRCCLSWASWIIHWRWVECAVLRSF
jgi:hypothetical protein